MSTIASAAPPPRSNASASVSDAIWRPLPPYQRADSIGSRGSSATNAATAANESSGVISRPC